MEYSSGIILYKILDGVMSFFVCTPDGPYWKKRELWNFPKGHIEHGETPFEAALREFKEETSVCLSNDREKYTYLGIIKQNNKKKVHVFAKPYENENLSSCFSNDCETIIKGVRYIHKEIKDYSWKTCNELLTCGMKCYYNVFKKIENDKYH